MVDLGTEVDVKQAESLAKGQREWIPLLDAIRGLAVLGVVMTHAYGASWISDRYDKAGFSGFAQVVGTAVLWIPILFWLSGFVIMMVMQPYFDAKRSLWSFFQRRMIRITPTWWFGIAFSLAVSASTAALHHQNPRGMSPIEWLTNLTYTPFIFKQYTEVGVGWTLFIEVQLYLAVIAIVYIVKRFATNNIHGVLAAVLMLTGLASVFFGNRLDTGIWFTSSWAWFALGSVNYLASYKLTGAWYPVVLAAGMLVTQPWPALTHLSVLTILILIAITIAFHPAIGQRHFKLGKSLTFLGDISYPYYLLHMPFVRHSNLFATVFERLHLPFWLAYPVVVLLPMAFAYIAKRWLDRVDKFLMSKLFPRKVASGK